MKSSIALELVSWIVAAVFIVSAPVAYGHEEGDAKKTGASEPVSVGLNPINDSGVSGTATFMAVGDNQTKVTIEMTGGPKGAVHPVHIHEGTCDSLSGVAYPLKDIKNGKSVTVLDASLDALTTGTHAINVHKSPKEASVYVACGAVAEMGGEAAPGAMESSGAREVELSEVNNSDVSGIVTLTPMEGQTKVSINLTGAPEGGVHPVHMHKGTCDSLGEVAYPLNDITNGTSETVLDASFETLSTESYAINVHKSGKALSTYVACGTTGEMSEGASGAMESEQMSGPMEVELSEMSDSGVSGTATLTSMEGQTKVSINLTGTPEGGVHPAHIHKGTCDNLGQVAYPLNDITNGTSETVLDAGLETLTSGSHAINVHMSSDDVSTYVACGAFGEGGHAHEEGGTHTH